MPVVTPTAHRGEVRAPASQTPEYSVWSGMLARCRNPRSPSFRHYGGRGIGVCERWQSFQAFFEDMGPRPSARHSIDRINNDGNYEPGNCRWATPEEQGNNTRRSRRLTLAGVTQTVAQWARAAVVRPAAFTQRIADGMPLVAALSLLRPQRVGQVPRRRVLVTDLGGEVHAALDGTDGLVFAAGPTLAEALGRLALEHGESLGLELCVTASGKEGA